jgi:ATP-dependent protease ClpP protease subunit
MVLFNSPGGSLMGGVALGNAIRKLGFDTGIATYAHGGMVTSGICASACAYAFAGGRGRYYSGGSTRLGIHQFYSQGNDISNGASQEVSGLLVAYLERMGVDALAFSASASVQPDDILWLNADEARRLHFANNGIEPTTAELKQVNGATYLRVEQKYTSYSARFLFNCARDGKLLLMGGIVTNPQDAKQTYDWATQSLFTFDEQTIQTRRKGSANDGLTPSDSTIWVTRVLAPAEVQKLLASKTITTWVAADGAVGHTGAADISGVRDKIRDFVGNCSFRPQVGQ